MYALEMALRVKEISANIRDVYDQGDREALSENCFFVKVSFEGRPN